MINEQRIIILEFVKSEVFKIVEGAFKLGPWSLLQIVERLV